MLGSSWTAVKAAASREELSSNSYYCIPILKSNGRSIYHRKAYFSWLMNLHEETKTISNDITSVLLADYPHVDKNSSTCVTESCCHLFCNVIISASHWNIRQSDVIRFLHCVPVNTSHKYLRIAVSYYVPLILCKETNRGGALSARQNIGCPLPTRQCCIANRITSRDWQIVAEKWSVNCDESFRTYIDDFRSNMTITPPTVNRTTTQVTSTKLKLRGLCPRANYTDQATAACRRSYWQILRIEGATWSAWRIPTVVFSAF
jgi:hypothetical protein